MDELVLRHHQVVQLMMRSLHHDAHEAKCLELRDLLGILADNGELHPIGYVFCFAFQPS